MRVEIPYGKQIFSVEIEQSRVAGVFTGNDVTIGGADESIRQGISAPLNSRSLADFINNARDLLFIVNDATRPTPTARILENIFRVARPVNPKFLVATGNHIAPTEAEYRQIFGRFYEEYKTQIFAHSSRADADLVSIGTSRNKTPLSVNRRAMEAKDLIVISSVEPHYFAGYTGGRKSLFPGISSFKSIEMNHSHAMSPQSAALALEGNPVHEDMVDALQAFRAKNIFAVMTVLDKYQRVYSTTAGHINDSFYAAVEHAREVFVVKVKEKADIVVTVTRAPLDINLYQSQKALEHGKLALKEGGIIILVSCCRGGIGDDTFVRLLNSCSKPEDVFNYIKQGYKLGYHKAAKLAEMNRWSEVWAVTDLPDALLKSIFIHPYHSLQTALNNALEKKGQNARVLFFLDGAMTVPVLD